MAGQPDAAQAHDEPTHRSQDEDVKQARRRSSTPPVGGSLLLQEARWLALGVMSLYVGLILAELDRREQATASATALARQMISQATPVEPRGFEAAIITAPAPQPAPRRAGLRDAFTAAVVAGALALALVFGTSAAAKARADVAMFERMQGMK